MKANPGSGHSCLLDQMPRRSRPGFAFSATDDPRPLLPAERAALYATALLTLLACAGTVVPLYLLARAVLPAQAAWAAAALWPLAPAANLFQPVADTAYPFFPHRPWLWPPGPLDCSAGQVVPRRAATALAAASGLVMALGMFFTLAFLPVGLIVGLTLVLTVRDRLADAQRL